MRTDLVLQQVRIRLRDQLLLEVDASVAPGEVLTLMGPSGAGKSTLLAYIGGFLDPAFSAEGKVLIGGRDVTHLKAEERHAGILFQDPLLFPHMDVAGNLLFGMTRDITGKAARRQAVEQALDLFELSGLGARDPATLSGGQKARVALARTLLSHPHALLLDEPFSKLDADLRQQMRDLVFGEARRRGLPTLLVTHDPQDAKAAGGPVIMVGE